MQPWLPFGMLMGSDLSLRCHLLSLPGGAPAPRSNHVAVWTGGQMLVWGGAGASPFNDTLSYTPSRVLYLYQRP